MDQVRCECARKICLLVFLYTEMLGTELTGQELEVRMQSRMQHPGSRSRDWMNQR